MSDQDRDPATLELAGLPDLPRELLVEHWVKANGRPPPKGTSRKLLERSAAYQIQARYWGDLTDRTRRILLRATAVEIKNADQNTDTRRSSPRASLRPGMRLVREWNGRTHSVDVIDNGFAWNGQNYRSLSAVAFAITGARWSGPRFFGL